MTTDVDTALFRQLLGHFPTGVAVITARGMDGAPVGMTANSLSSVSLAPPLLSVCIDRQAETHRVLADRRPFVVNLLSAGQEGLSRRFAGEQTADRFAGVGYRMTAGQLPVLEGVLAHIECEYFAAHELGDHTLFVGRVTGGSTTEGHPLLYYRGGYADLTP
ncbi:MAG TPA: flavin reductase family protein [Gemmatimonadales bacterium]|nr:flavin reductase family protein [Gemmatimonadales bacterium]